MTPSASDKCQRGRAPVVFNDGSIAIPLTRWHVARVDAIDYPLVSDYLWHAMWVPAMRSHYAIGRARTATGLVRTLLMHRLVLDAAPGQDVDHIEQVATLDNRRSNLRLATRHQNMANRRSRVGTSRFKGVCWNRQCAKWQASVQVNGRPIYLGLHATEESAAVAYDAAARRYFGERAFTNEMAGLL